MKLKYILPLAALLSMPLAGQEFVQRRVSATYLGTFDPAERSEEVMSFMYSTAAPHPGGTSAKSHLLEQKRRQDYRTFPKSAAVSRKTSAGIAPTVGFGTPLYRLTPTGSAFSFTGGIPNDNAMAVSKDGIICAAVNSAFWAYDTQEDKLVLNSITGLFSLKEMANGSNFENYYDPKLIYDPEQDRFVLVFLKDNDAENSRIIVAFSSTNHPNDPWHVYRLDGNPLDNNRWTDFPAIALSSTGLVITGNLIVPNVSWQVGFDGSVIWHLDKLAGYQGGDVNAHVYTQIAHQGKMVRNLHPVRGHDNITDQFMFLSNRNFDLQNDTIFLIGLEESESDTAITTRVLKSTLPYGVPPNGKQADTDTTDASKGLQTNDARVLGAIQKDEWIQFVSTTAHGNGPTAGIFHGFIDLSGSSNRVHSRILWDAERDYAYPNISWSGVHPSHIQCLIGFDFTSMEDHPGMACVHLGNDTLFSETVDIINGTTYVDRHSDSYERWGDYFSIQPHFDQDGNLVPQSAWMAGFYGDGGNQNRTYIAQIFSNDSIITPYAHTGKLFPNPAGSGFVTIEFNVPEQQYIWGELYTIDGQLVQKLAEQQLPFGPAQLKLDVSTLSNGSYVVVLTGDYGFSYRQVLLKE